MTVKKHNNKSDFPLFTFHYLKNVSNSMNKPTTSHNIFPKTQNRLYYTGNFEYMNIHLLKHSVLKFLF